MRYRITIYPDLVTRNLQTGAVIAARCTEGLPVGARFLKSSTEWASSGGSETVVALYFEDDVPGDQQDLKPAFERVALLTDLMETSRAPAQRAVPHETT